MNDEIVSDQTKKPVLDEKALERLLEAAFVLQEHNREQQQVDLSLELHSDQLREQEEASPVPPPANDGDAPAPADYTATLAKIVETQRHIQVRHLELEGAMALVVERIAAISGAAGAAIGILEGKKLRYRAVSGPAALAPGTEVPMEKALCLACLRVGQVIRCTDINTEFLFDVEECRRRGIASLIAVPIYHDGEITGALELFFARSHAFTEQDVHSCQLIAGLVTEAFARHDEISLKQSLAAERATMLNALEKLQPDLAAMVGLPAAPVVAASTSLCPRCGQELGREEQFCGNCGSPRTPENESATLQNQMAAMLKTVGPNVPSANAGGVEGSGIPEEGASQVDNGLPEILEEDLLASLQASLEKDYAESAPEHFEMQREPALESALEPVPQVSEQESSELESSLELDFEDEDALEDKAEPSPASGALVKSPQDLTWTSAAKARETLEQLAAIQSKSPLARFWNSRRGDIYLAAAVVLVAVVIRWGIWSNHSVSATGGPAAAGHRRPAPDADLSVLDRLLISVGLAEPPEAPEYHGNPETEVWVDLHTALYYCPGTDLYGKTPKGKYTTQRDAQLDQFEPAARKACD